METPLTILYTHRLRGDLEALPKLYSFMRQLQAHYSEAPLQVCADDPIRSRGSVLRLDLGESCPPEIWHCSASSGRSTLVVLDGMGYDAARADDATGKQAKMGDSVRLALVDDENPYHIDDVVITVNDLTPPSPSPQRGEGGLSAAQRGKVGFSYTLQISLAPAETTHLDGDRLYLAALSGSQQVGVAQLTKLIGRWALVASEVHDLPRRVLPDPTIAASVEFVLSEARYAQKRQSS